MNRKDLILHRLDELIEEGEKVHATEDYGLVAFDVWNPWRVSMLSFCAQLLSTAGTYYEALTRNLKRSREEVRATIVLLQRIRDDYAKGYLQDLRELAAADVFTDFLDMADHLHENGYHIPAASIAGAVLEDCLRRLHLKHIGPWQGDSGISKLNDALRRAEVYGQAVWRQIQVWGDIRNDADHGRFDKVDSGQVKQMIAGIREFIPRHEG